MPHPARAKQPAARPERETANDDIYEKIYVAILEHRLHPGTKLGEDRLANIFNVSRARVREVLAQLAPEIVDAIARRDLDRARKLMLARLDHIEQGVSPDGTVVEADLEAVFFA